MMSQAHGVEAAGLTDAHGGTAADANLAQLQATARRRLVKAAANANISNGNEKGNETQLCPEAISQNSAMEANLPVHPRTASRRSSLSLALDLGSMVSDGSCQQPLQTQPLASHSILQPPHKQCKTLK